MQPIVNSPIPCTGKHLVHSAFQRIAHGHNGINGHRRSDMTTARTVSTEAANVLRKVAPPIELADLAKSCVNTIVWITACCSRGTTRSRTRIIRMGRLEDVFFFSVVVNHKLSSVLPTSMIQFWRSCFI